MKWNDVGVSFISALALIAGLTAAKAANAVRLNFVTHAAFFSAETHQAKPIDPQVFVRDSAAPAAMGPQGIKHVVGVRPAFIEQDANITPLVTADGKPLGFTLGQWLDAQGFATIKQGQNGRAKVSASFTHLQSRGHYSLFENHFDQQPISFTPLDGTGKDNNFIAGRNGNAKIAIDAPKPLTHANALLLVYHSDKTFHGSERGDPGVNAHHQLIARIPE